ncbi:glycosyltransferase [Enterococcus sp. BWT-B8]|uniref:glycosyltransferase n=1 Tax=Enterococcus sp. BWT-B8 TaxID=2885157 RepID=UPI001E449050|nr:glycosyltransferase [Enterococcus sp. BWT-B8]MCB5952844.1 glycosyltransferase [Enterococcus sp. BWT-B8]
MYLKLKEVIPFLENNNREDIIEILDTMESLLPLFFEEPFAVDKKLNEQQFLENILENYDNIQSNIKISGLIMVRNQEVKIKAAINSLKELVDELVVVDTGSTDNTISSIREIDTDKIKFYEYEWEENFSFMRNKIFSMTTGDWVIILDSDEVFTNKISYKVLKNLLGFVTVLTENRDVSLQIQAFYPNSSRFILPDRIIKKSNTVKFYGKVHEEPRSTTANPLKRIQSRISVVNAGASKEEVKRFNKESRYAKLTKEMIAEEPNNPRWVVLSKPDAFEDLGDKKYYENLLLQHIKVNKDKPLSKKNVNNTIYLKPLLDRYVLCLMNRSDSVVALKAIKLGKELFPNNINFIMYEYAVKKINIDIEMKCLLDNLLFDFDSLDQKKYVLESQKNDDFLKIIIVKMLISLGNYEKAAKIFNSISDPYALESLTKEKKYLNIEG